MRHSTIGLGPGGENCFASSLFPFVTQKSSAKGVWVGTVSEQMRQGSLGPGPAGMALSPRPSARASLSPWRGPSPRRAQCALGVDLWARSGCAFDLAVITGGPGLQTRPEHRLRSVPGVAVRLSPGPTPPSAASSASGNSPLTTPRPI